MDLTKLNILVDQDRILNIEDLINTIESLTYDFNTLEYLETLSTNLRFANYSNSQTLQEVLASKILEMKMQQAELSNTTNNAYAMETLKSTIPGMERLKIIETKKEDNDSKKDIDYIAYTREDGTTEMLVCRDQNTLNNFIKNNASMVANMTAEEIFHHFKEYIHVELEFMGIDEKLDEDMARRQIVREDEVLSLERHMIEEYLKKEHIDAEIEYTVDPNGERIYRIDEYIIKFTTNLDGRQMQVISQPPKKDNTLDLLDELDNEVETYTPETISHNIDQNPLSINLEDLNFIFEKYLIDKDNLPSDEMQRLCGYIDIIIDDLTKVETLDGINQDHKNILDQYMNPIMEIYNDIEEGIKPYEALSKEDYERAAKYSEIMEKLQALEHSKEQERAGKILALEDTHMTGMASTIILLEIGLAGALLLLLISCLT